MSFIQNLEMSFDRPSVERVDGWIKDHLKIHTTNPRNLTRETVFKAVDRAEQFLKRVLEVTNRYFRFAVEDYCTGVCTHDGRSVETTAILRYHDPSNHRLGYMDGTGHSTAWQGGGHPLIEIVLVGEVDMQMNHMSCEITRDLVAFDHLITSGWMYGGTQSMRMLYRQEDDICVTVLFGPKTLEEFTK